MAHRIHIAFRTADGVRQPAGSILELSPEDLEILGNNAEAVEPEAPTTDTTGDEKPAPPLESTGDGADLPAGDEKPAAPPESTDNAMDPPTGGEETAPPPESARNGADLPTVLAEMDAADPGRAYTAWWTKDGKPKPAELKKRGVVVTAAERDRAWAEHRQKA